jgi:hypothetical protein
MFLGTTHPLTKINTGGISRGVGGGGGGGGREEEEEEEEG